ncbi:MAG: DUF1501 domain-containing protein [Gammaproteobacteria bacterium]
MTGRRQFLRSLWHAGAFAGMSTAAPRWVLRAAHAAGTGHTLLVVFLRGGCDGLNVVVPYGDDAYHRLRPTLRIPAPTSGLSDSALELDGFFGLHPALRGVHGLYRLGRVALLPAVHYPDASRSHFESQALIEQATATDGSGWLNRYLYATARHSDLQGIAFAQRTPAALRGPVLVRTLQDLASGALSADPAEEAQLLARLGGHADAVPGDTAALAGLRVANALALQDLGLLRSLGAERYVPAGGVTYPAGEFGTALRDTAFLVKSAVGLEVATIDLGGWDTHVQQGAGAPDGRQARALALLDSGLTALMTDLAAHAADVTVLVMTEFGRTAEQNASGGTDHGNASAWMVLGGRVRGGLYLGATGWPGLTPDRLREGRDLAHTLEFRVVMAEVLTRALALPTSALAGVLPGGPLPRAIGFL